jgi:threonylcarbamoyladenosine tRNA methylthiotransferase MtaB
MGTFCVLTAGCRVKQADSLELERELRQRGHQPASAARADVVVVNTCSVTATADQGARQTIRRVQREHPAARIVVTGCYASRAGDELAALPGVIDVVKNVDKDGLSERVAGLLDDRREPEDWNDGPCGRVIEPGIAGRTAWTLRVQTGCAQPCAFCVIPSTRGRPRSRSLEEIGTELDRVCADGFKEVVISGVHLGAWGRDLTPPRILPDLLRYLASHPSHVLIRISSLEPMDCTAETRVLLAGAPRFAPHFHLPLQHASDGVLAAMCRPYTREYYSDLVHALRAALPHASIGSDILVGFPGETDDDHAEMIEWLGGSPLTHLHVFPYSDRPGTRAEALPGKVHGAVIRSRAADARRVGQALTARFMARMAGTVRPGLTLEDGTLVVTDNYLKVRVAPGLRRNERVLVRIDRAEEPLTGAVIAVT